MKFFPVAFLICMLFSQLSLYYLLRVPFSLVVEFFGCIFPCYKDLNISSAFLNYMKYGAEENVLITVQGFAPLN